MELLLRVSLCLLTFIGKSLSDEIEWVATEDSDTILPCSPIRKDNLTDQVFDWKKNDTPKDQEVFFYDRGYHYNNGKPGQNESFKNRVEFFQDKLRFGNASIRIKKTKLTDAGIYSCAFPHLQPPEQKVYIKLVVGCILKDRTNDPERKYGTCPKPTIQILRDEQDGVKVQCEVRGAFPEPKMELLNRANDTIEAEKHPKTNGNYFDINLQALVNKKDFYRCVVKQEKICHQIYSVETLVLIPFGIRTIILIGVGAGIVVLIIVGALIVAVRSCKRKRRAKSNETFTLKDCLTQDQSRPPSAVPPAQDLADSKDDE